MAKTTNPQMDSKMIENIKNYGNKIKTIESFVEAVRKIPGMYIGATGNPGFINMIREIFQNSIDQLERNDSPCDHIWVFYDESTHTVIITDNGTGIPFDNIIRIFTSEHTSSNYDKEDGQYSAGVHGVGSKVTNALSSVFIVESYILGDARKVEFTDGKPWDKGEQKIPNKNNRQGTTVTFRPSYDVMGQITTTVQEVFGLVASILPLTKIGSIIDFVGLDAQGKQVISEQMVNQDGIITDLILKTASPLIKPIIMKADTGKMKADIAFTYDSGSITSDESVSSFSNFCPTLGGTHVDGFMDGLTRFFREYMNKIYLSNNSKLTVVNNDIKSGLKAIVVVSHIFPKFTGQAKQLLGNEDMVYFVKDLVYKSLEQWSKENPNDLQKLCKYFKEIAEIRVKSDESKIKLSTKYQTSLLTGMPKKYVKPSGNKNLELIIVEGDSALGSAKNSRCTDRQGLFPIRGKVPNAFAKSKQEFLSNQEIASIITIIGGGYGKSFDITKVKWEKIIFMADADPDGAHINSLLLRFFLLYLPELILDGRVYRAVPPLFGVKIGNKQRYFTDKIDYTRYIQTLFSKSNTITTLSDIKLTNNEAIGLFVTNVDYTYELEIVSNMYAINPYLLETVLGYYQTLQNSTITFKQFKKSIEDIYRFIKVREDNGIIIVEGLVDSKYQTLFINDKFINGCKKILDIMNKNTLRMYKLNGEIVSIYTLMKAFEASAPSSVTRYKGLGEQNPEQLAESTLHPDHDRTLIRYTIEDIKQEIESIRYLESNRALLLSKNTNISRQDIE